MSYFVASSSRDRSPAAMGLAAARERQATLDPMSGLPKALVRREKAEDKRFAGSLCFTDLMHHLPVVICVIEQGLEILVGDDRVGRALHEPLQFREELVGCRIELCIAAEHDDRSDTPRLDRLPEDSLAIIERSELLADR